jgi:hypothetical protein
MFWNFPKLKIYMKRQFQAARANRLPPRVDFEALVSEMEINILTAAIWPNRA